MKIISLKEIDKKTLEKIKQRSFRRNEEVVSSVRVTIANVKKYGEAIILKKYRKQYNTNNFALSVTEKEIKNAYSKIDKNFLRALKQAIKNITVVHAKQLKNVNEAVVEVEKGIQVWRTWRSIEKVGLYIPGGKAIYPSSALMTGIPATLSGCREIIMCSPPNNDGEIPAPTLIAADMIGLKKIFKVGGAEAIAAMAIGTKNIPKVYKIFGAGNAYVTEAKMQVYGIVDIDIPAGPSEIFIIADDTANPAFIAADLLADGEHGEDSACVLVTTSKKLAEQVNTEIENQLKKLSTRERIEKSLQNYGLLAVVDSLREAIEFCNDYAPEHLEIMTKQPEKIAKQIINAGSVFLGNWTTKSAGDYATGANHVLPTGGMAKMFNPLSVESFGKKMQVQKVVSRNALRKIKDTIGTFADVEGLPAHKNATVVRFERSSK